MQLIPGNTQLDIKNSTNASSKQRPAATRLRGADMLLVSGAVNQAIVLGPITVQDPGLFFGATLKTVLAAEDIRVYGEVVRRAVRQADGSLPKDCHVVAVQKTPLGDALARAGKDSLGMAAEAVMKTLGAVRRNRGSWPNGIAVVGEFLRRVGVSEGAATLDDGSGLSRNNRISPEALVAILQYMHRQGGAKLDLFRKSLSHCGVDGSLKKRMKQVKDRVIGKTGYISGVRTLSGYVQPRSGHWLAFSFLYNNCVATRPMTQAQDEACRLLADSTDLK